MNIDISMHSTVWLYTQQSAVDYLSEDQTLESLHTTVLKYHTILVVAT